MRLTDLIPADSQVSNMTFPELWTAIRTYALCALLLAFATSRVSAETLDIKQYRGKVVLVDFWASWCEPCRHSFPWLNAIQEKYAEQGLVIIGVNVDRERAEADRFLKDTPAQFKLIFDPSGQFATQFDVPGMPSSYVFGPDGTLIAKHIGFRESAKSEREAEIQRLLQQSSANSHSNP